MPTVKYNNEYFSCSKAVKGVDYIRLLDNAGKDICLFGDIHDFSKFVITDGTWAVPDGAEEIRATASISGGMLLIAAPGEVGDGTLIKFKAPCDCMSVTKGLSINGVAYTCVDANGTCLTGTANGGVWSSGAMLAIVVDTSTKKAYLQSSDMGAQALDRLAKTSIEDVCQIGDCITTVRTDLGSNWLLCNGAPVSKRTYQALFSRLSSAAGSAITFGTSYIRDIATDGTTFVAVSSGTAYVSTDAVTWTTVSVDSGVVLEAVAYGGGTWCAIGYTSSSASTQYHTYTTSKPTGSWTKRSNAFTSYTHGGLRLVYGGNRWVAVLNAYNTANPTSMQGMYLYAYSTTTPSGEWASAQIDTSRYSDCIDISYGNNMFVVLSSCYNSSGSKMPYVYSSTNGTAWSTKAHTTGGTGDNGSCCNIAYDSKNTRWIAYCLGKIFTINSALSSFVATSLVGTDSTTQHTSAMCMLSDGTCAFTLYNNNGVNAASSLRTADSALNAWKSSSTINIRCNAAVPFSDGYVLAGSGNTANTLAGVHSSIIKRLPVISLDGAYTYIKAK